MPKYTNLKPVSLFGSYTDPYANRRGTGSTRPPQEIPCVQPAFCRSFEKGTLYFSWLGHSSVFLCIHGKKILIDPVFSKYASPVSFAGPMRFPGKSLQSSDFPELDLILITHNHYDHLDKAVIRALDSQTGHYIVPSGVGKNLQSFGVDSRKITELGWYEAWEQDGLSVISTPSQHGSARSLFDRDQTLWCSYILKDEAYTVFDTGDGGFGDHFSEIHRRYGDVDLAIMECGQYNERWHNIHMFPEESAAASKLLNAGLSVPVHWGAYVLSDHPWDDPPKRFRRRAEELGVSYQIPSIHEILEIRK